MKIYKFIDSDGQLRYQVISGVCRPHLEALAMFARASCQECGGLGWIQPRLMFWLGVENALSMAISRCKCRNCVPRFLPLAGKVRLLQPWKVMNLSFWGLQQLWLIQLWVRSLCVAMGSCKFWFPNNYQIIRHLVIWLQAEVVRQFSRTPQSDLRCAYWSWALGMTIFKSMTYCRPKLKFSNECLVDLVILYLGVWHLALAPNSWTPKMDLVWQNMANANPIALTEVY